IRAATVTGVQTCALPISNNITYQIGPTASGTGAVVTDRPLRIFDPFIRVNASNQDTPLTIISRQEYEQFGVKSSTGSIPNSVYRSEERRVGKEWSETRPT